jgi:hypothetical protein
MAVGAWGDGWLLLESLDGLIRVCLGGAWKNKVGLFHVSSWASFQCSKASFESSSLCECMWLWIVCWGVEMSCVHG